MIEGRILFLVDVDNLHLRWLLSVRKGSKNLEMDVASVSASLDPKVGAGDNLTGAMNRLKFRVRLASNLFDLALKANKHFAFIFLEFSRL